MKSKNLLKNKRKMNQRKCVPSRYTMFQFKVISWVGVQLILICRQIHLYRQIWLLPSSKNDLLKVLLSILNANVTDFKIVHILFHSTKVIHLQCIFHLTHSNFEVGANSTTEMSWIDSKIFQNILITNKLLMRNKVCASIVKCSDLTKK